MAFEIIKNSKLRPKIEEMLASGLSPRRISEWTRTQGQFINHVTIFKFKKECFNFAKEAVAEMKDSFPSSIEIFRQGKQAVVSDIEFCNDVIEIAHRQIREFGNRPEYAGQFKSFCEAGIRAIETKLKIAGEALSDEPIIQFNQINIDEFKLEFEREIEDIKKLQALGTSRSSSP